MQIDGPAVRKKLTRKRCSCSGVDTGRPPLLYGERRYRPLPPDAGVNGEPL